MKRGTPDHWKMKRLAELLEIPDRYAIIAANGIMERLWHYTARYHPQGNIGAAPNWAIADACGWNCGKRSDRVGQDSGKVAAFVDALVVAGWLDRDNVSRLLVHDWPEHADTSVKKLLKDKGLEFCHPTTPEGSETTALAFPKPSLPIAKPSKSKTIVQRNPLEEFDLVPFDSPNVSDPKATFDPEDHFEEWWRAYWRKTAKENARRSFVSACRSSKVLSAIMAGTKAQTPTMLQSEERFRPHGATWLNQRRWEDPTDAPIPQQPRVPEDFYPIYRIPKMPEEGA